MKRLVTNRIRPTTIAALTLTLTLALAAALALAPGAAAGLGGTPVDELCERPPCAASDVRFQGPVTAQGKNFGFSVAFGRIDGDDLSDVAVGAPEENRVYVFFGRTSTGIGPGNQNRFFDAAAADLILTGPAGSEFGFSVDVAPGVGPRTLIVGAPATASATAPGAVYVAPGGVLNGLTGTVAIGGVAGVQTIAGQAAGDQLGYAVATAPLFAPAQDDWVFSARGAARAPAASTRWSRPRCP